VAQASYTIGTAAPVGQWSVRLVPSTGTPITVPFYVGYKADITALAATGGDMISTPVAPSATAAALRSLTPTSPTGSGGTRTATGC